MTNTFPKISALVITYNEEEHIGRLIDSLDFADEIILVDSFSTDKTKEIALSKGVQFIEHTFENFSAQRNFSLSLAKHEWVVFFDADEVISMELRKEIIETLKAPKCEAYRMYRKHNFMNKVLKYSAWQTDNVFRLFKKTNAHYQGKVHERLFIEGKTGALKNKLDHLTYTNFDHYVHKLHHYADIRAKELYDKGKKPSAFHFIIKPIYRFLHSYFIRLGILDGQEGLINCMVQAWGIWIRYVKLKELINNK